MAADFPVVVERHDLRLVLEAVDNAIESLDPAEVQALERLSNAIGFAPIAEGPWYERVGER